MTNTKTTYTLRDLTVIATDGYGEETDLNATGEPCRTVDDLRAFVAEMCEQGLYGEDVRDALIAKIEPATVSCECGAWSGERCGHRAVDLADTVIVEFMPEQYRAGHGAARNRGSYPGNGATRIRVATDCADSMIEADGDWCEIVE